MQLLYLFNVDISSVQALFSVHASIMLWCITNCHADLVLRATLCLSFSSKCDYLCVAGVLFICAVRIIMSDLLHDTQ